MHGSNGPDSAFYDDVAARAARQLPPGLAPVVAYLARAYGKHVTAVADVPPDVDELAAEVAGMLQFADSRGTDDIAVRVFAPRPEVDGYRTPGSVVETNTIDVPFLIDSATAEIHAREINVVNVVHPVVGIERNAAGRITGIGPPQGAAGRESVAHFELDRPLGPEECEDLERALRRVLDDVLRAVRDFGAMEERLGGMIAMARSAGAAYGEEDIEEAAAFLEWLRDNNFVFLGYREYDIVTVDGERSLVAVADSGLGILSRPEGSTYAKPVPLAKMPPDLRARHEGGLLVVITKTNSLATVHRRAKMDYIGLRKVNAAGEIMGEARLLGLFTSRAYMAPASRTPLLRKKLQRILASEDISEGSHDYRTITRIFESFPKDELFAAPRHELHAEIMGLLHLKEQQQVKLFVKRDLLGRSVSVLVALPRDRFNAELRKRLQRLFTERFRGSSVDYRLSLGDAGPARIHFTVWVGDEVPEYSLPELEAEVADLARTWEDRLGDLLAERFGPDQGLRLAARWAGRFPDYYKDSTSLEVVAGDIVALDRLADGTEELLVGLQDEPEAAGRLTRLAVYRKCGKLELSRLMQPLEDLGLRVVEEIPTRLLGGDGQTFIHDFGVLDADGSRIDPERRDRIAAAASAVFRDAAESDSLHRLVVTAGLRHEQIAILRAYRTYWTRVGIGFTEGYLNDTLAGHPDIAAALVRFFEVRFAPEGSPGDEEDIRAEILSALDRVESLDEDRILRGFLDLMTATMRTNAFREDRRSLSFKFRSDVVPAMPRPYPRFEIFVYAPEVEGIHLRGGMIARGGIRWSTRREDYRTEVLGLMKAQMTKNAVIVPTGAKGGFVLRRAPDDPALLPEAVRTAYTVFIRGLLDITDNLVSGTVMRPAGVRVHDGDDPYLVVAADKGTATFSDTANELAAEYGFWMGDAFASGGSAGYDHKALGITARGAWESVKWHLREMDIDVMRQPVTVVGIGDMSGDVFGNGMLLSPALKLVAAFDHRHVFIDPDPDPAASFAERQRMFRLPRSSWDDYDRGVISRGGGVWSRRSKRIELSPEAAAVIGTDRTAFTPDELIRTILLAPVTLLWNGGIGTYVKASSETHEAAGDKTNDAVRVNGRDLRCAVVAEGGNLGLTQPGRIEFVRNGGKVFTDFIDNSGGVNCSDREVNLKILLGLAEEADELERADRDALVQSVAPDVVERILYDSFLQAQILSQEEAASPQRLEAYQDLIEMLEAEGELDREIEFLPTPDELIERARSGQGMTAPELAVLLTYAKRDLRRALLNSPLPEWPHFVPDLFAYFPEAVTDRFGSFVSHHPLRREILATIVANQVVNSEGITFVSRLMAETGAGPADVVRAYRIARDVTGAGERWRRVEDLIASVPSEVVGALMAGIDSLVEAVTRWHLAHPSSEPITEVVAATRPGFLELEALLPEVAPDEWREEKDPVIEDLLLRGTPADLTRRHAYQAELAHAPDIIDVARRTDRSTHDVARVFFLLGPAFGIDWLERQIARLPMASRWHRRALETVGDDLVQLRRDLSERVLEFTPRAEPEAAVQSFVDARGRAFDRLQVFLRRLAQDGVDDVSSVIVAIRQIRAFAG